MGAIRLICIVLMCEVLQGLSASCRAQELVNLRHVVQRGETIETMAEMYNVSTEMLKRLNDGMDTFYTGMEVMIPVDKKYLWLRSEEDSEAILKDLAGYLAGFHEATRIFNAGDYKKASKAYYSNMHEYGRCFSCEETHFAMAMCEYNRKRWSSAIDLFTHVIGIDGCSEELRDYSIRLKDEAVKRREARRERTANIFGEILQAAAEVGTAYMAASQSVSSPYGGIAAMPQGKSLGSMSDAEFSAYINSSLSQIANISVVQVQQRWAQEEMQFKNNFIANYRHMHGRAPSAEEVQSAYNDYMQTKANAYNTVRKASSGLYDKELGISGNKSTSNNSTRTVSGYKCTICRDTHVCQTCNGSGWQHSDLGEIHDHYGAGIGNLPCGNCSNGRSKGSGVCQYCK